MIWLTVSTTVVSIARPSRREMNLDVPIFAVTTQFVAGISQIHILGPSCDSTDIRPECGDTWMCVIASSTVTGCNGITPCV